MPPNDTIVFPREIARIKYTHIQRGPSILNVVYDFDRTIYDGDSTLDFYWYCLKRHPNLLRFLPRQCWALFKYSLGFIDKTNLKQNFYCFLQGLADVDIDLQQFWRTHKSKIKKWYLDQRKSDDVIISASPEFLLKPVCAEIGIVNLIASHVDKATGHYTGLNCHGSEKVERLRSINDNIRIAAFYSDSLSDLPLAQIADKSYIVAKDRIIPWAEYKPYMPQRIMQLFFSKEFFWFLMIGGINIFTGVLFAYLFSLLINPNLSFVLGYIVSLSLSYLMNSLITFKEALTLINYAKFCASYIPNFLIQNIILFICFKLLSVDKLFAYCIAAIIGVPITFLALRIFAFRKSKQV